MHEVHTIEVTKVALNRDYDKRISGRDGISTFEKGHKDLSWSPILGEVSLTRMLNFSHYIKMPHSNFKSRATEFRGPAGAQGLLRNP